MLSRPHINYQYWQQPMRNTLPQVSFVQRMDPSHPTTFVSTRSTIENSLGAFPGDNQIHCAQGYSSPDPTMLVLDPYGASSHWVEVSSGGPMDTTFTANPSVPWLTVSPKDGKIAADGSTDTKVYISVDWSQVPAPSSNQSFSAVGNVDFTSSDGAMMTATVPIKYRGSTELVPRVSRGRRMCGDGSSSCQLEYHGIGVRIPGDRLVRPDPFRRRDVPSHQSEFLARLGSLVRLRFLGG